SDVCSSDLTHAGRGPATGRRRQDTAHPSPPAAHPRTAAEAGMQPATIFVQSRPFATTTGPQMPHHARTAWTRTLGQLAILLAVALVAGLLAGHPWPVLTVAALGIVAWHYWRLRGVLLRLTARQRVEPSRGNGVWNELDRLLYRGQEEMRGRKRRLVEMLRAYSAAA